MFATKCVILTLILFLSVATAEMKLKQRMKIMADEIDQMKLTHKYEIANLKKEIDELKKAKTIPATDNHERNEKATLRWARSSMKEVRNEMKELSDHLNNSVLLGQLHTIRNELKQALTETSDLSQIGRTTEVRTDRLETEVGRLKYESHQHRNTLAELRTHFNKLSKEIKTKQVETINSEIDIMQHDEIKSGELKPEHNHKYRHNKMIHAQISRLARTQEQLDELQQSLQTQILDVERRLDRYEEPNWNLMSAKVEFLELESKVFNDVLKNVSQKMSDFDKIHASILELREDVESIENKADKTIPEFRKEISKLDVNFAQLNAQSSYIKEDQDNLRQSVKAIAVSVSNSIDRAEMDRISMKNINSSVFALTERSKQHFYRLNDHITKSEAIVYDINHTDVIPLPELMGEVKELQPVQREYEDLINQLPKDCSTVSGPAGVYLIHPGHAPFDTWCMNGSTLIQRRYNGSVEFNRKFSEYTHGFGNPSSEYWLGLESMHIISADNCSSMRIDMTDIYGGAWYAEYEHFSVGSGDSGYILDVSGFSGNASDAFEYQNHMEFSAIDRDRDISNTHCAGNYEGGWWFSHCQHVNINGKYTLGLTWFDGAKNEWIAVATSEMRMFRRPGCS